MHIRVCNINEFVVGDEFANCFALTKDDYRGFPFYQGKWQIHKTYAYTIEELHYVPQNLTKQASMMI